MQAKADNDPETLLKSVGCPATPARLQVATNSPSRERAELPVQVAVDITQGPITEFAHLDWFIGVGLGRGLEGSGRLPPS